MSSRKKPVELDPREVNHMAGTAPERPPGLPDGWRRDELGVIVGDNTIDNPRRPDVPAGTVFFTVVEDRGNTMIVDYDPAH